MLVKYHQPGIDFADVVALSGVGSSALHLDFPEISLLSTRLADQSIVYMASNMGASYVLGYERGGTGSDPFYPVSLAFEDHAAHLVSFENGEDALNPQSDLTSLVPDRVHCTLNLSRRKLNLNSPTHR